MNYNDTFIEIAEDCPATEAVAPATRGTSPTLARLQYEMIAGNPYVHTQENVLFETYARHKHIPEDSRPAERERFFSKGQPCLRASPLTKQYGWGVHSDGKGHVALYPAHSPDYQRLAADTAITHLKAMRSKRAAGD